MPRMKFRISHLIAYRYSLPVFLEPHTFRLCPRSDGSQRVVAFSLEFEPRPSISTEVLDPEGNRVLHAWFEDTTESLKVRVHSEVETLRSNPFDYILLDDSAGQLPMRYAAESQKLLAPCCTPSSKPTSPVARFARSIAEETGMNTLTFVGALNQRLYETSHVEIRDEGDPLAPEVTLASRRGACRDLAVLFTECCRLQGIAARFVSGYQEGDPDSEQRHLHAWAEVYLPGGGWRGYDPTLGLTVADGHVALAASANPALAAPSSGTFRGTGAASTMEANLEIQVSDG